MPNILIVCTANICRSPMAMVLLRRKIAAAGFPEKWNVASAGTWARDGFLASENGRILMSEWGMDLSKHRSRVVNADILAAADLVLTMERGHKEALQVEFPTVANRIYLLSEMTGPPVDILDPYGGPMPEYEETAKEIESYLERGFGRIVELARSKGRTG